MTARRRYRNRTYAFGKQILTLRTRAGLTQHALAQQVGVHVRSVQNWEVGESYPRAEALQRLIAVLLNHRVFTNGSERQEAEALWELASNDGPHALASFDAAWFAQTIALALPALGASAPASNQTPHPVPSPTLTLANEPATAYESSPGYRTLPSSPLYGRERELAALYQWIVDDHCRVVILVGPNGIGKSHLAVSAVQHLTSHFDLVVFQSLHNQPPLNDIIDNILHAIADPQTSPSQQGTDKIALLVQLFRERRCLLILDQFEALLQSDTSTRAYHAGYGEYGTLLARLGVRDHQSCLLLASRTLPPELGLLVSQNRPVHALTLDGVDNRCCNAMLQQRGMVASADEVERLSEGCNGNPLALHLTVAAIHEVYAGDIQAFLDDGMPFTHLDQLIEQHFSRLTPLEQTIVHWLAIEREFVSVDAVLANLVESITRDEVLRAFEKLYRLGLVEGDLDRSVFALPPTILQWITSQICAIAVHEIVNGQPDLLHSHALIMATASERVRLSQERLIALPLLEHLTRICAGQEAAKQRILHLLAAWRVQPLDQHGYGPGNALNLLRLQRGHLRNLDMTHLLIRQAYLEGVEAQAPNLAGSTLQDVIFADRLWQTWRGW